MILNGGGGDWRKRFPRCPVAAMLDAPRARFYVQVPALSCPDVVNIVSKHQNFYRDHYFENIATFSTSKLSLLYDVPLGVCLLMRA